MELNQPASFSEFSMKPKTNQGLKIFLLVGIFIVIVVGTLVYAKVWQPWWSPFKIDPEKQLQKMFWEMNKIKTFNMAGELSVEGRDTEMVKFAIKLNADIDQTDKENPKSSSDLKITITSGGYQITSVIKTISLGQESYFKIESIPFPYSLFLPKDWIKVSEEIIENLGLPAKTEEQKKKTQELTEKLINLLKNKKLILVKELLPNEKINETDNYHYVIVLNKEEWIKLVPDFSNLLQEYILGSIGNYPLTEEKKTEAEAKLKEEIPQKLTELIDKVSEIPIEIWFGKKDTRLYRIKIEHLIVVPSETQEQTILFKAQIDFSKFNQVLTITAPAEFKPLDEVLKDILSSYLGGNLSMPNE